jgi:hypothetical protein
MRLSGTRGVVELHVCYSRRDKPMSTTLDPPGSNTKTKLQWEHSSTTFKLVIALFPDRDLYLTRAALLRRLCVPHNPDLSQMHHRS